MLVAQLWAFMLDLESVTPPLHRFIRLIEFVCDFDVIKFFFRWTAAFEFMLK